MTPHESLQKHKAQFEELLHGEIDRMLNMTTAQAERVADDPQVRQALMQSMLTFRAAADAYRQALVNAAPHVTQEVGEDYHRAARELPTQLTFLWSALAAYQARKTGE